MVKVITDLIPAKYKDTRPGGKMKPKYITIHETDNESRGANAYAHAKLQENHNSRQASWHYQVDDTYVYQSIPDDEHAWAAGDGFGEGNMTSIHIEVCVNKDGNFKQAVKNAAELTAQLMDKWDIDLTEVVQHNHWSGKNCPRHLRAGDWCINWNDFRSLVKGGGAQYYTMKNGDNFWKLETKFGLKHGTLAKLNPKLNPTSVPVGTKIRRK